MTMTFDVSGNLTADPKFENFGSNGGVLVRLRIASDRWVTDNGASKTVPEFYNVTLFDKNAVQALEDAKKGDPVTISGDVRPHSYSKDGVEVHTYNLIGKTATWQSKQDAKATREHAKTADLTTEYASQEHFNANFRR